MFVPDCNFNQSICLCLMISILIRVYFCRNLTYDSSVYIELVFVS
jgi:hypothetical protein